MNIKKEIMEEFKEKFVMKSMYGNHINFHADPVLDFLSQALTRIEDYYKNEIEAWSDTVEILEEMLENPELKKRMDEIRDRVNKHSLSPSEEKEENHFVESNKKECMCSCHTDKKGYPHVEVACLCQKEKRGR